MRYHELLTELFDQNHNVAWRVKNKKEWAGSFQVGASLFDIDFVRTSPSAVNGSWHVLFEDVDLGFGNTGVHGGAAIHVISTVVGALSDLIRTCKPGVVLFSGSEDTGKARLYRRILARSAPELSALGYRVEEDQDLGKVRFRVLRALD